jgi:hypothetical protein
MNRHSPRPGFALLMALALVLLAGAALAGLARWSAMEALESTTAADELKHRWAVVSCRETLLGRAEQLLDAAERGEGRDGLSSEVYMNKPMPELRVKCRLSELDYELVLTDEQAKLNLNTVLQEKTPAEVQSLAARLTHDKGDPGSLGTPLQLRRVATVDPSAEGARDWLPLGAYGQIFEDPSPEWLVGRNGGDGLASPITCWGDGKVNLRRAPAAVIEAACMEALGPQAVSQLLAARLHNPYGSLSAMLVELDKIDDKQKRKIGAYVTDHSMCHGLWIIAHGGQRSRYTLTVRADGVRAENASVPAGIKRANFTTYDLEW